MALNQIDGEHFSAIAASSNTAFERDAPKAPAPQFERWAS